MALNEIIIDDKIKELLAKIDSGDDKAKATLGDYYNTLGVQYFSSTEEDNVEKSIYCFEESIILCIVICKCTGVFINVFIAHITNSIKTLICYCFIKIWGILKSIAISNN